jgi:hypothetical protein
LEIVVAIIPLNDAASKDDSNGGHFIFSLNLDLSCENPAAGSNLKLLGGK